MNFPYGMDQQQVLEEDYDENYEPTEEGKVEIQIFTLSKKAVAMVTLTRLFSFLRLAAL